MKQKPAYYKPGKHSNKRRAVWHDYSQPSLYMLTYTCLPGRPPLSDIQRREDKVFAIPSELGRKIAYEIERIPDFHPQIKLYDYVVMPDHVHFIIYVTETLPQPLGNELSGFSKACNNAYRQTSGQPKEEPLFESGFHDRLIMRRGQLDACRKYIADNPRRRLIKQSNPDLFRRYNHLQIGDRQFAAYGNIFLLRNFDRRAVAIHRADSPENKARQAKQWLLCATNGGVLISPFISKEEKAIRDEAIDAGGSLIILRNEAFEDRFKPSGQEFDLCAEGRLLLLAPWPENPTKAPVSRSEALHMNALASSLATTIPQIKIIRTPRPSNPKPPCLKRKL